MKKDKKFNVVKSIEEKDFIGIKDYVQDRVKAKFQERIIETKQKLRDKSQ